MQGLFGQHNHISTCGNSEVDTIPVTLIAKEDGFIEVTRGKKLKKRSDLKKMTGTTKQSCRKPTTLLIKAEGQTYADILKTIKSKEKVKEIGGNIHFLKKTNSGHLRIELARKTENAEKIIQVLSDAIGAGTQI